MSGAKTLARIFTSLTSLHEPLHLLHGFWQNDDNFDRDWR
jgi:hypothetical protein